MNKPQQLAFIRNLNFKKDITLLTEMSCLSEDHLQAAVCTMLDYIEVLYWSTPNGSNKSKVQRSIFASTGLVSGVPDILIAEPKKRYHGLFLELKNGTKGKLSENQKNMISKLQDRKYCCEVARNLIQAKEVVFAYLK